MKHRSRIIKGEFFQNPDLAKLSAYARLLFIGLWTVADRKGRLQNNSILLKAMVFPYESVKVEPLLVQLEKSGFIQRYKIDSFECIQIVNFLKHQKIHSHEAKSELPNLLDVTKCNDNVIKCSDKQVLDSRIKIGRGSSNSRDSSRSKDQEIPFEKIITHLNHLSGKNFDHFKEHSRKWIKARWREKYTLENFYYVNQIKAEEWLGTEREQYLRPKTLYSPEHFETYLNQRKIPRQYSEKINKALVAAAEYLKQEGFEIEANYTDAEQNLLSR